MVYLYSKLAIIYSVVFQPLYILWLCIAYDVCIAKSYLHVVQVKTDDNLIFNSFVMFDSLSPL